MMQLRFFPKILENYFSQETVESCKTCKRYGQKACCPPKIEPMKYYKTLLPTYSYGILLIEKYFIYDPKLWREIGKDSSLDIGNRLYTLKEEYQQFNNVVLFGAGSCKYCSEICDVPCKFPDKRLVPLEATGLDIVKLVYDLLGITLVFPVKDYFYRIGAMLYNVK